MKKIITLGLGISLIAACNNDGSKETKPVDSPAGNKPVEQTTVAPKLVLDTVPYPGNVAYAVFQQNGKTLFYYNVDTKKGYVSINKEKFDFDFFQHKINEPDFVLKSGSKVYIKVEGTKFSDYENPEPGILKGKAAKTTIVLGSDTLKLDNLDVIDGTNAD